MYNIPVFRVSVYNESGFGVSVSVCRYTYLKNPNPPQFKKQLKKTNRVKVLDTAAPRTVYFQLLLFVFNF